MFFFLDLYTPEKLRWNLKITQLEKENPLKPSTSMTLGLQNLGSILPAWRATSSWPPCQVEEEMNQLLEAKGLMG